MQCRVSRLGFKVQVSVSIGFRGDSQVRGHPGVLELFRV